MANTLVKTIAASAIILLAGSGAYATVFAAWKVAKLDAGDTLNVRKYPSAQSQKQAAYPNGTVLQMTGKCTGGINLLEIAGQPDWKQEAQVRHKWCEVWHDPARDGNFVTGWIYGRYIAPH